MLYRGDLTSLVMPLSMFKARPGGPRPNAGRLEVVDFGQTVKLGEFEASADSLPYELDADYRRGARARLVLSPGRSGSTATRLTRPPFVWALPWIRKIAREKVLVFAEPPVL